ncbi:hypothetical protein [Qipengyuania sp. ASV99]|uniref:hypothetical protein n=1 Tax=Qipengyuania sp. ASV99 TaxID=3399681 RepID=UPI003A4C57A2
MSVTANFYSSELIEPRCEIHFACAGFWNPETMRRFLEELNQKTLPLIKAGKPIYALGDFTDALPQDRETADLVADHLANARKFGLQRVAIINATALMKMQYKRVSKGLEVEFFDDVRTAERWLRENRDFI